MVLYNVYNAVNNIKKSKINLNGNRIDNSSHFKCSFLELHDRCVVDAGPLREDQNGQLVGVLHMFPEPSRHSKSVFGL